MSENSISSLIILRQNNDNHKNTILELYDPENNNVNLIPHHKLENLESIQQLINSIKSQLNHPSSESKNYLNWQKKGWHKAIDYYISSRDNHFSKKIVVRSESAQQDYVNINLQSNSSAISTKSEFSVPQALINRRTKRVFRKQPVVKEVFYSGVKNATCNIVSEIDGIKLYFIVYNVEEIIPSVYYYNFQNHQLQLVREGQFSNEMSYNLQGMKAPKTASFTIIVVAEFEKLMKKMPYARGLRDSYIEIGRLSQKLVISYQQYGIFSLVTPALRDRVVSNLLMLDEDKFAPLYSITFGYPLK